MEDLIKIAGLSKLYLQGEIRVLALNNISLSIKKGEFIAIMGPSGSGKSTLMNILGCLDRPTKGEYFLEGELVSKFSKDKLAWIRNKKIGFIFQNFNLIPKTTVLENIEVPLFYHNSIFSSKKNKEKVLKLLEAVGLKGREKHLPSQLSGGEQQRVAIARALINDPHLILADEPTGNLDTKISLEIMSIFQKLNKEKGITIVMITHEADIASRAKRVISFSDGEIQKDYPVLIQLNAEIELKKYLT